ncbi:MAG: flagellar biosynthetic protein FliO [Planctomycetota bacterium]|nr:flagellar biosynthetic protein FliO [Planctomycetota bacterium]
MSPQLAAQDQRGIAPLQPQPTWVSPAGFSLNQPNPLSAPLPQSTTHADGQREFNPLPLPPRKPSPRPIASTAQPPNRMAQNSFPEVQGSDEVVQASYNDVSAPAKFAASTSHSQGPLELRPSSKDKAGSVERPKSSWGNAVSVFLSLAVVLSFFLLVAWLVKKSQPTSFLKLPGDVVQVMGRTPMAPRQQMYVVRFGSKLLLISHQPGQTQTLGEITDADEVQRLAGLCEANHPGSISNSFRDVLKQVAMGKPAPPDPRPTTRLSRGRA